MAAPAIEREDIDPVFASQYTPKEHENFAYAGEDYQVEDDHVASEAGTGTSICEAQGSRSAQEDAYLAAKASAAVATEFSNYTPERRIAFFLKLFETFQRTCGDKQDSGSTVLLNAIQGSKIYTATLGDSYSLLFRKIRKADGTYRWDKIRLNSKLHHLDQLSAEEKATIRIAARKYFKEYLVTPEAEIEGKVDNMFAKNRLGYLSEVMRGIAVCGAIGDKCYDKCGFMRTPYLETHDVKEGLAEGETVENAYVATVCDGFFENGCMTEDRFLEIFQTAIDAGQTPQQALAIATREARSTDGKDGSTDNLTGLITPVDLTPHSQDLKIAAVFDGHGGVVVSTDLKKEDSFSVNWSQAQGLLIGAPKLSPSELGKYITTPIKHDFRIQPSDCYSTAILELEAKGFTTTNEIYQNAINTGVEGIGNNHDEYFMGRILKSATSNKTIAVLNPVSDSESNAGRHMPYRSAIKLLQKYLADPTNSANIPAEIYIPICSYHFGVQHFRLMKLDVNVENKTVTNATLIDSKPASRFGLYPAAYLRQETAEIFPNAEFACTYTGKQHNDYDCGRHVVAEIAAMASADGRSNVETLKEVSEAELETKFKGYNYHKKYVQASPAVVPDENKKLLTFTANDPCAKPRTKLQQFGAFLWRNKWRILGGALIVGSGIVLGLATAGVGLFAGAGLAALGLAPVVASWGSAAGAAVFTGATAAGVTAGLVHVGSGVEHEFYSAKQGNILKGLGGRGTEAAAAVKEPAVARPEEATPLLQPKLQPKLVDNMVRVQWLDSEAEVDGFSIMRKD